MLNLFKRPPHLGMPTPASPAEPSFFKFDDDILQEKARVSAVGYNGAHPFPHAVIDNFLPVDVAERIHASYPGVEDPVWFDWKAGDTVNQPKKLGVRHASRMEGAPPLIHNMCYAFNSYTFLHFLETLTGLKDLISDPTLEGGGMHQILPGGKLRVHADFNMIGSFGLYRKLNAILYLNKDWDESWGGDLQLWDKRATQCEARVMPHFNRLVVFSTLSSSYHGHPEPLACPEGRTRKSLAFFYYSKHAEEGDLTPRSTQWQAQGEMNPV